MTGRPSFWRRILLLRRTSPLSPSVCAVFVAQHSRARGKSEGGSYESGAGGARQADRHWRNSPPGLTRAKLAADRAPYWFSCPRSREWCGSAIWWPDVDKFAASVQYRADGRRRSVEGRPGDCRQRAEDMRSAQRGRVYDMKNQFRQMACAAAALTLALWARAIGACDRPRGEMVPGRQDRRLPGRPAGRRVRQQRL